MDLSMLAVWMKDRLPLLNKPFVEEVHNYSFVHIFLSISYRRKTIRFPRWLFLFFLSRISLINQFVIAVLITPPVALVLDNVRTS